MRRRAPAAVPFPTEDLLLVGVDGGATEVKAHAVVEVDVDDEGILILDVGEAAAAFRYPTRRRFEPVALPVQLHAFGQVEAVGELHPHERDVLAPTHEEIAEGALWIECAARAIASVAASSGAARLVVGMCMPGLKTRDRRGIAVMKNG